MFRLNSFRITKEKKTHSLSCTSYEIDLQDLQLPDYSNLKLKPHFIVQPINRQSKDKR